MQRIIISVTILFSVLTGLSGCTFFPGVHKIDIQQGNRITQELVDTLEMGMTHNQVKYILGTPMITDTFNQSRWDYLYSLSIGGEQSAQERLTLLFKDDHLTEITGDYSKLRTNLLYDSEYFLKEAAKVASLTLRDLNQQELSKLETQTPQPAPTEAVDTQHEIDTTIISDLIKGWSIAWSSQNLDHYFDYYDKDAQIKPNISRSDWEKTRRSRILAPDYIQVTVKAIEVSLENPESATASFRQYYHASNYQDSVFKTMSFTRSDESWKIIQEQATSELQTLAMQ
ncbi:MAG: outer membrane protein assembly factor BamE [Motiliproteus sp.]|jgi:outer membrane protein assembly factor BamE